MRIFITEYIIIVEELVLENNLNFFTDFFYIINNHINIPIYEIQTSICGINFDYFFKKFNQNLFIDGFDNKYYLGMKRLKKFDLAFSYFFKGFNATLKIKQYYALGYAKYFFWKQTGAWFQLFYYLNYFYDFNFNDNLVLGNKYFNAFGFKTRTGKIFWSVMNFPFYQKEIMGFVLDFSKKIDKKAYWIQPLIDNFDFNIVFCRRSLFIIPRFISLRPYVGLFNTFDVMFYINYSLNFIFLLNFYKNLIKIFILYIIIFLIYSYYIYYNFDYLLKKLMQTNYYIYYNIFFYLFISYFNRMTHFDWIISTHNLDYNHINFKFMRYLIYNKKNLKNILKNIFDEENIMLFRYLYIFYIIIFIFSFKNRITYKFKYILYYFNSIFWKYDYFIFDKVRDLNNRNLNLDKYNGMEIIKRYLMYTFYYNVDFKQNINKKWIEMRDYFKSHLEEKIKRSLFDYAEYYSHKYDFLYYDRVDKIIEILTYFYGKYSLKIYFFNINGDTTIDLYNILYNRYIVLNFSKKIYYYYIYYKNIYMLKLINNLYFYWILPKTNYIYVYNIYIKEMLLFIIKILFNFLDFIFGKKRLLFFYYISKYLFLLKLVFFNYKVLKYFILIYYFIFLFLEYLLINLIIIYKFLIKIYKIFYRKKIISKNLRYKYYMLKFYIFEYKIFSELLLKLLNFFKNLFLSSFFIYIGFYFFCHIMIYLNLLDVFLFISNFFKIILLYLNNHEIIILSNNLVNLLETNLNDYINVYINWKSNIQNMEIDILNILELYNLYYIIEKINYFFDLICFTYKYYNNITETNNFYSQYTFFQISFNFELKQRFWYTSFFKYVYFYEPKAIRYYKHNMFILNEGYFKFGLWKFAYENLYIFMPLIRIYLFITSLYEWSYKKPTVFWMIMYIIKSYTPKFISFFFFFKKYLLYKFLIIIYYDLKFYFFYWGYQIFIYKFFIFFYKNYIFFLFFKILFKLISLILIKSIQILLFIIFYSFFILNKYIYIYLIKFLIFMSKHNFFYVDKFIYFFKYIFFWLYYIFNEHIISIIEKIIYKIIIYLITFLQIHMFNEYNHVYNIVIIKDIRDFLKLYFDILNILFGGIYDFIFGKIKSFINLFNKTSLFLYVYWYIDVLKNYFYKSMIDYDVDFKWNTSKHLSIGRYLIFFGPGLYKKLYNLDYFFRDFLTVMSDKNYNLFVEGDNILYVFINIISFYINFIFLLLFLFFFIFNLRKLFLQDGINSFSPFYEWSKFNKNYENNLSLYERNLLFNIVWLDKFQYYWDKYYLDDLIYHIYKENKEFKNIKNITKNLYYNLYEIQINFPSIWHGYTYYKSSYNFFGVENLYSFFRKFGLWYKKHENVNIFKNYFIDRFNYLLTNLVDLKEFRHSEAFFKKREKMFLQKYFSYKINSEYNDLIESLDVRYFDYWFIILLPYYLKNMDLSIIKYFIKIKYLQSKKIKNNKNENIENILLLIEEIQKNCFKGLHFMKLNNKEIKFDFHEYQYFEDIWYDSILYNRDYINDNDLLSKIAKSRLVHNLDYDNLKGRWKLNLEKTWFSIENYFEYLIYINNKYLFQIFNINIYTSLRYSKLIDTFITFEMLKEEIDINKVETLRNIKTSVIRKQMETLSQFERETEILNTLEGYFKQTPKDSDMNKVCLTMSTDQNYVSIGCLIFFYIPIYIFITTSFLFPEFKFWSFIYYININIFYFFRHILDFLEIDFYLQLEFFKFSPWFYNPRKLPIIDRWMYGNLNNETISWYFTQFHGIWNFLDLDMLNIGFNFYFLNWKLNLNNKIFILLFKFFGFIFLYYILSNIILIYEKIIFKIKLINSKFDIENFNLKTEFKSYKSYNEEQENLLEQKQIYETWEDIEKKIDSDPYGSFKKYYWKKSWVQSKKDNSKLKKK